MYIYIYIYMYVYIYIMSRIAHVGCIVLAKLVNPCILPRAPGFDPRVFHVTGYVPAFPNRHRLHIFVTQNKRPLLLTLVSKTNIQASRHTYTCLPVYLSVCLSVCLSTRLHVYTSTRLPVYLSTCLSVCVQNAQHQVLNPHAHMQL